jgi:uncharacterized membrane protein YhaH (DUF805 family)
MFEPIRKYAQFSGRARRAEYWMFALLYLLIYLAYIALGAATGGTAALGEEAGAAMSPVFMLASVVYVIIVLALLVPSIAVTIRRLHDTNRSGWWWLIAFIPILGGLVLLIFAVLDGTPGDNRYGPDPKGRGAA